MTCSATIGFDRSRTANPIERVVPSRRLRARTLGSYPASATAAITRRRRSSVTYGPPDITRDTLDTETPAISATALRPPERFRRADPSGLAGGSALNGASPDGRLDDKRPNEATVPSTR